uniref:TFIIS N-terminal domain-containing protein n=1 Tax=Oryza sativa subsp. japonica TaxID=39947 RepID=Q2QN18_ORYSJ|nr:hypothetical protein LOC_Os12g39290 [Oryza sativa Japonica Group]
MRFRERGGMDGCLEDKKDQEVDKIGYSTIGAFAPEDELLSLLQSLADMDIPYKALQETDIGRHVNGLRKHPSGEVRLLAISSSSSSSASPWTGSSAAATAASWLESGSGSATGSTTVVAVAGSTGISATSCFSLPWNPSPRW